MRINLNAIHPGRTSEHAQISRLLLIAAPSALFEGLARAIDDRLSLVRAEVHDHLPDAADHDTSVRLVMLHHDGSRDMAALAELCTRRFPKAAVALLVADMCADCTLRERMFQEGVVQGVVPLTLKLDVWIAAVSMLLNGGEYYPPARTAKVPRPAQSQFLSSSAYNTPAPPQAAALFVPEQPVTTNQMSADQLNKSAGPASGVGLRPVQPALRDVLPHASANEGEMSPSTPASRMLEGLTVRERQILELVSEGHQNKLIAHRISLSEHTVKVHVHNLLTKLRVTNRTQAAAAFRTGLMWIDKSANRNGQGLPVQPEAG